MPHHVAAGAGSRRGQKYVSVSGDEIANEGEQRLPVVSNNAVVTEQKWQLAAVTRPLQSFGEMCDAGNRVVVGLCGGIEVAPYIRENGDLMDMWIPPAPYLPIQRRIFSGWAIAERVLRRTAFASTHCQPRETFTTCRRWKQPWRSP